MLQTTAVAIWEALCDDLSIRALLCTAYKEKTLRNKIEFISTQLLAGSSDPIRLDYDALKLR